MREIKNFNPRPFKTFFLENERKGNVNKNVLNIHIKSDKTKLQKN